MPLPNHVVACIGSLVMLAPKRARRVGIISRIMFPVYSLEINLIPHHSGPVIFLRVCRWSEEDDNRDGLKSAVQGHGWEQAPLTCT